MPANLPSVLVGIILAAYWMRVLHLARKIRREVGHTANVIPPGVVGCDHARDLVSSCISLDRDSPFRAVHWQPAMDSSPADRLADARMDRPRRRPDSFHPDPDLLEENGKIVANGRRSVGKDRVDCRRPIRVRPPSDLCTFLGADARHGRRRTIAADDRRRHCPSGFAATGSSAGGNISLARCTAVHISIIASAVGRFLPRF